MKRAIDVVHLAKRYGAFTAVDDVTFHVDAGQVLALLGPNGAGKSTCIEILVGLLGPSAGSVRVLGTNPRGGDRSWRARIGLVLQSTSLDRQLTVSELFTAYARVYPRALPVADVLAATGLADDANTRVGVLSGGQQRRVDLGLGIIGRPELLFLDEPTTGLDPQARRDLWSVVHGLTDGGATVLLTTHYLEEAQQLADRIVVLNGGRVVADATPDELRTRGAVPVVRLPLPPGASDLPPALAGSLADGELLLHSPNVGRDLAILLDWARRHRIDLAALQVGPPSLEQAYLALTREEALSHD